MNEPCPAPTELLKEIHGEDAKVFTSCHHARYFEDDMAYHIISRTIGGMALLVPSEEVNRMVAGVLGHVQQTYPQIQVFAYAFLSNHFHFALRGHGIPRFVGLLKQELSRRLRHVIDVPYDALWSGRYAATALPLEEDQLRAFEYILAHGVKEGLVETPEEWPGVHCARSVFRGEPCTGEWLNSTAYGRAKLLESRRPPEKQREVKKSEYTERVEVSLTRLPAFDGLDERSLKRRLKTIRSRIIEDGREARGSRPALGVKGVLSLPRTTRFEIPLPPWFENRNKKRVVWSDLNAPETQAYLHRYHTAQRGFADASRRYRAGERDVMFPAGMYLPPVAPRSYRSLKSAA